MDKQAGDTVLVMNREMTGRTQTLLWWLGREGVKTTENIGPVGGGYKKRPTLLQSSWYPPFPHRIDEALCDALLIEA